MLGGIEIGKSCDECNGVLYLLVIHVFVNFVGVLFNVRIKAKHGWVGVFFGRHLVFGFWDVYFWIVCGEWVVYIIGGKDLFFNVRIFMEYFLVFFWWNGGFYYVFIGVHCCFDDCVIFGCGLIGVDGFVVGKGAVLGGGRIGGDFYCDR